MRETIASTNIEPYCHNVEMADTGQLYRFNSPVQTDYNAWWFCILPLEPASRAGLPAPIFIRGDDFEYGQRLAALGVPTVTLPGVAVWHEPFYAKPPSWQDYYDLRNRMIFAATYGNKVSQLSLTHLLGLLSGAVLTHQYQSAELRMRAVEDFLRGPKVLFAADAETTHKAVMALAKAHAPERVSNEVWSTREPTRGKPKPPGLKALAGSYFQAMLQTLLLPRSGSIAVFVDADAHPINVAGRAYVLTNGLRTFHILFRPSRRRTFALLIRAAKLTRRFRRERVAVGKLWAEGIPAYRRDDYWGQVFGDVAVVAVSHDAMASTKAAPSEPAPPESALTQA